MGGGGGRVLLENLKRLYKKRAAELAPPRWKAYGASQGRRAHQSVIRYEEVKANSYSQSSLPTPPVVTIHTVNIYLLHRSTFLAF